MQISPKFGAVLVPSNEHNRRLRQQWQSHNHLTTGNSPSYVSLLYNTAGDPDARGGRGEWYTGVLERGELVISDKVADEVMAARLMTRGFENVRIIPNDQLGDNIMDHKNPHLDTSV